MYAGRRPRKAPGRVEFIATCSCKQWVGYAGSEKTAKVLVADHVRDAATDRLPAFGGEHVVNVRETGFWD